MARCPDCAKFVGLELADPEPETPEVVEDGTVTVTVRIVRNCSDCGQEMKEATLELEYSPDEEELNGHVGEGHELLCDDAECSPIEESGGRYAKSYFGAEVTVPVYCRCQTSGAEPLFTAVMSDKVAASEMEELV